MLRYIFPPSRYFQDFEEEWIRLGEESYVGVFDSRNSPKDPYVLEKVPTEGVKRRLSETEDSLILTRRKMSKNMGSSFTQHKYEEDDTLKNFRKENPGKYRVLERRTFALGCSPACSTSEFGLGNNSSSPICIPSSPTLPIPSSPTLPINASFAVPPCPTPEYSPSSPIYPSSPNASFAVPTCPTPKFALPVLPAPDHTLSPLRNRTVLAAVQPRTPITTATQSVEQYPLKEELGALLELIESVRVDMLQTTMLVNYIQDYLKRL